MELHPVRTHPSAEPLPREEQLAWRIAALAADPVGVEPDVAEMIGNRIIDNAAVAVASLARPPVVAARAQALHSAGRSTVVGLDPAATASPEWAAWANGVAVRELDFHDTFLAAEYSHPGDNIPPVLAVAQHAGRSGHDLVRALATAYEVQVDLVRAISLHAHKIDHVAHLGPSAAAGLGTLLGLAPETTFHAVGQALHTTTATRQSRKGEISTWKAYAPAFAGKAAVEAVDRAMRGQTSPTPIYEGEDGVIARLLAGPEHTYQVPLPAPGEPKRGILATYTKEHSAEYQAQALIDLARRLRPRVGDTARVASVVIRTSHHTHTVIGTGAGDPQKMDPRATRETLDHSIAYIVAVALQDGVWHHERSYAPERAQRADTVALWQKVRTVEDPEWTRRYHAADPAEKAFGGRVVVTLDDGTVVEDELAVADAHPLGSRPFARAQYVGKLHALAEDVVPDHELRRFLRAVEQLEELPAGQLHRLTLAVPEDRLGAPEVLAAAARGIF